MRLEASFATSQAPSFEDVRLMVREEIRAALAEHEAAKAEAADILSLDAIQAMRFELHDQRSPLQRTMRHPENV